MKHKRIGVSIFAVRCSLLFLPLWHAGQAAAQAPDYPVRPIRLIIPWATGGSTDAVIRILAPKMAESLGQPKSAVFIRRELATWSKLIRETGIRAD